MKLKLPEIKPTLVIEEESMDVIDFYFKVKDLYDQMICVPKPEFPIRVVDKQRFGKFCTGRLIIFDKSLCNIEGEVSITCKDGNNFSWGR